MNRLTAFWLACLTVLFMNFSALAQHGSSTPQERADKITEWMKTHLSLTADQIPRVQEINSRYARQMSDLRNSAQTKQEKMAQLKALSDQKDGEMKTVLNADQYKTYEVKKQELEKMMKEKAKERKDSGVGY